MTRKRMLGILAGGAIAVLAFNIFEADAAGSMVRSSPLGTLLMIGLGLVGIGMWGKGKWGKLADPMASPRHHSL